MFIIFKFQVSKFLRNKLQISCFIKIEHCNTLKFNCNILILNQCLVLSVFWPTPKKSFLNSCTSSFSPTSSFIAPHLSQKLRNKTLHSLLSCLKLCDLNQIGFRDEMAGTYVRPIRDQEFRKSNLPIQGPG